MQYDTKIIQSQLEEAAAGKEYFLLRGLYTLHRRRMPEKEGLYWDAVVYNLFGREYLSLVAAGKYLSSFGPEGNRGAEMTYLTGINRLRRFRYRAAGAAFGRLLRSYRSALEPADLEEAAATLSLCRALRNLGPQKIERNGIRSIPARMSTFGHITVGIECGQRRGDFILDTGANFCTVGRTAALKMGLVRLAAEVEVGTATGIRLECRLAYAPALNIAGITVRNAVFLVMEDNQLSFPEIGYSIEGIVGFPVIRQLGNLRFGTDRIDIGNTYIPRGVDNNFCIEGLMPVAEVTARGERLMFTLDTGANQSEYSCGYYNRHLETLDNSGTEQNGLRGGGGGVVRNKTLTLAHEILGIGGRGVILDSMNVIRDDYEFSRGKAGNLGLDALMAGGGFALSFDRMALYPYPKKKRARPGEELHST